ncbi:response regulator [Catenovulum sp. SM1970]|uniref:response regulator n=1 Tax=Marinifaba aquimaris TaxID=2741323 RepID=UPI001571F832|nr:response regulator [Marinifaba aquimaris]NTS77458.1 response regulator [Marinifaba aquimaris]
MENAHVLVFEDEAKLAQLNADYLSQQNFQVSILDDGAMVIDWVQQHQPNAIILDLMLPNKDGMTICKELRQFSDVPILMVTARVDEIDRLLGLELGADDYICKPFSPREVVARVKTVLRRTAPKSHHADSHIDFSLDKTCYQAKYQQHCVDLTAIEFEMLSLLSKKPGQIFNRDQLMTTCYPDNRIVSGRTIDSHIKKLRQKLESLKTGQELIQSVYGVGYKFTFDT